MIGFYLFAAVVGVGLLTFSLIGSDGDAADHSGDAGSDFDSHGVGEAVLAFFRPRNLVFLLATLGVTGTLLTWLGRSERLVLVLAVAMGVGAMLLSHVTFSWARRASNAGRGIDDIDFVGANGRVVLPLAPGQRGRIACIIGDREQYVIARLAPGIETPALAGREIVIVEMRDGVAEVAPLDP